MHEEAHELTLQHGPWNEFIAQFDVQLAPDSSAGQTALTTDAPSAQSVPQVQLPGVPQNWQVGQGR